MKVSPAWIRRIKQERRETGKTASCSIQKAIDQTREELNKLLNIFGSTHEGAAAKGFDPVKRRELTEKMLTALERVVDSGKLSAKVAQKLMDMLRSQREIHQG